jgi:Ankyrin repeats (3 copies)
MSVSPAWRTGQALLEAVRKLDRDAVDRIADSLEEIDDDSKNGQEDAESAPSAGATATALSLTQWRNPYGQAPLHWAAEACGESSKDITTTLIERIGCEVNAQDLSGLTALHWAAKRGDNGVAVARVLLDHGADRDKGDKMGRRPIDVAPPGQEAMQELLGAYAARMVKVKAVR